MPVTCPRCQHVAGSDVHALPDENCCPGCGAVYDHTVGTLTLSPQLTSDVAPRRLGKFHLLEEVGSGAFGTVYKAHDPELDRVVAIKVPRAGVLAKRTDLERFLREARSVARLQHPRIVPIHEVGEADGVPFIVSEFVDGVTLSDLLSARPLKVNEAARLIADVADALEYAHTHGVIHRDVKPPNILLGQDLTPHLMDFGLAKRDGGADNTVTLDGQVLGTPAYMSPEQARGDSNRVDGRSDLYSLGVILYQLLAGELPFRGNLRMLLHQVQHSEPRSPRSLNDRIPSALETICLKCLQKEPWQRYDSAASLAEDLRRFLRGEAIVARPLTNSQRAWNWAKRRPALAASLTLLVLVTVLGFSLVTAYGMRAENAAVAEASQRDRAEKALILADRNLYLHRAALAYRELLANNPDRAQMLLEECPHHLRDWEWHFVKRACNLEVGAFHGHEQLVAAVAISPNGKLLASSSASPVQFNQPGELKLWSMESGNLITDLMGHVGGVFHVAFSPDSRRLVSAGEDGTVRIWDLERRQETLRLRGHSGGASAALFSPDGRLIVSTGGDYRHLKSKGEVIVWDAETGQKRHEFRGNNVLLRSIAISRDGQFVAASGGELLGPGEIHLWNLPEARAVQVIICPSGGVNDVAFNADGTQLAGAVTDMTVRLWDLSTGSELRTLTGHSAPTSTVAYSPDGQHLASASGTLSRGETKIWDPATGKELHTLRGATCCAAFAPDASMVATASSLRAVKLWDVHRGSEAQVFRGQAGPIANTAISHDGRYLAAASFAATVSVWDLVERREVQRLTELNGIVRRVAFDADGARLVTASGEHGQPSFVQVWNVHSGRLLLTIEHAGDPIRTVAFSPDGTRIAGGIGLLVESRRSGLVKVWDAQTGKELRTLRGHEGGVSQVIWTPDGKSLVSGSEDRSIRVWDADTGANVSTLHGHVGVVQSLAFNAEGTLLASTGWDGMVRIWSFPAGQIMLSVRGGINFPTFNRDSTRLAAVGIDQTVRMWDVASGQEALTIRGHAEPVRSVLFSPDGRRLITTAGDEVKVWDGSTFEEPVHSGPIPRLGVRQRAELPNPKPGGVGGGS